MFFVKMQFTSLIELGIHDISKKQEWRFIYSYILSLLILSITTIELLRAFEIIQRKRTDYEKMSEIDFEVA
jgi:hypothetical protein